MTHGDGRPPSDGGLVVVAFGFTLEVSRSGGWLPLLPEVAGSEAKLLIIVVNCLQRAT
jgi:hypothetical protein